MELLLLGFVLGALFMLALPALTARLSQSELHTIGTEW
jgi:hypothetical protein